MIKQNCKLTYSAVEFIRKYIDKLNKQELLELFSSRVFEKINIDKLDRNQLIFDELKLKFEFYDEKNSGYLNFDDVVKIF